jgi:hypothetical protein
MDNWIPVVAIHFVVIFDSFRLIKPAECLMTSGSDIFGFLFL